MKKWVAFALVVTACMSVRAEEIEISAKSAIVLQYGTGQVVYAKNAEERLPMASTTKIMTALLVLEGGYLDDIVTIGDRAARTEGSSIYLKAGEKLPMETLLYGLMLSSGNDAAVAIAEHVAGDEAAFSVQMTERAKTLGCVHTQFKNANGLPHDAHYTTALDLARIAGKAMEHPKFREIVATKSMQKDGRYFSNHNKLLSMYDGAIGIKTGYTKASGRTLVSAANREGVELICVTLSAPNDWEDHKKLLDFGFSTMQRKTVAEKGEHCGRIQVLQGVRSETAVCYGETFSLPMQKDKTAETVLEINEACEAPVAAGQMVGTATFYIEGVPMGKAPLVTAEAVDEVVPPSFWEILRRILDRWHLFYL